MESKRVEPYPEGVDEVFKFIINHKLDSNTFEKLLEIQDDVFQANNPAAEKILAGNIEREYELTPEQRDVIVPTTIDLWTKSMKIDYRGEWDSTAWINFQKKHEFNPLHNHTGEFSFVVWTKIPYNLDDEMNLPLSKNSNMPCASLFCFAVSEFMSSGFDQIPYRLDKHHAGWMVVFPSQLAHIVYPFYTSDEYRVSFAGNVWRKE